MDNNSKQQTEDENGIKRVCPSPREGMVEDKSATLNAESFGIERAYVKVSTPATSANVGSGYDCIGMAVGF